MWLGLCKKCFYYYFIIAFESHTNFKLVGFKEQILEDRFKICLLKLDDICLLNLDDIFIRFIDLSSFVYILKIL